MRYRLILIFLLLLLISIISSAQIRVGALAGLNSTSFSGDTPQGANFASNVGYSGGITADLFFLDDVSVLLQPMYSHKTSTIQFDVNYQYDPIDSMDLFIDYVEIPLNVKVTANNKIAYVTAGLTFSIPLSATIINNTLGSETDIKEFFEYQHAAKEWLALFLRFDLSSRMGSDFATLVEEGINYSTTFNIGWMIKVLRSKRLALSATVEVNNGDYSIISLDQFTEDIIAGNPDPSLIVTNNALYGIAGLKASYGINYFLGFSGEADLGYGEPIQKGQDNEVYAIVGAEADMNFNRLIKVPISLIMGYLYSSYPRNNSEIFFDSNIFYGQLNYIGRADFILSLELALSRELSKVDQSTIWPMTLVFSMRYLF